jgi:hypothetical protein
VLVNSLIAIKPKTIPIIFLTSSGSQRKKYDNITVITIYSELTGMTILAGAILRT